GGYPLPRGLQILQPPSVIPTEVARCFFLARTARVGPRSGGTPPPLPPHRDPTTRQLLFCRMEPAPFLPQPSSVFPAKSFIIRTYPNPEPSPRYAPANPSSPRLGLDPRLPHSTSLRAGPRKNPSRRRSAFRTHPSPSPQSPLLPFSGKNHAAHLQRRTLW